MRKEIKTTARNPREYVELFNAFFHLTDREMEILAQFVAIHLRLKKAQIQVNPFAADMRRRVAAAVGLSDAHQINPYVKSLKDKGAILKIEGGYEIHPHLIPLGESEIVFQLR